MEYLGVHWGFGVGGGFGDVGVSGGSSLCGGSRVFCRIAVLTSSVAIFFVSVWGRHQYNHKCPR